MNEAVNVPVEKKSVFCTKTNDGDTVTWTFSDGRRDRSLPVPKSR